MEEELARAKQCLEENVERIEQATVRLDGAGKSDIPPEVLETSLAKLNKLLAKRNKKRFGGHNQEAILASIAEDRLDRDRAHRELKRKREKFELKDFPREWPDKAVPEQLRTSYTKQRKRLAAYERDIKEVRARKTQYENVLRVIERIDMDALAESSNNVQNAKELFTTRELLMAIRDKLAQNPWLERRLRDTPTRFQQGDLSEEEGTASSSLTNQEIMQFLMKPTC